MTVVDPRAPSRGILRAQRWAAEPDISARSVLVTILGDTVAPLGGTIWLGDLIALAEPFGFNDRLVRTSLFRLAAEGWVDNERIGRRSRYRLTEHGQAETAAAETRIYQPAAPSWDGWWTLVLLDRSSNEVARHLGWRGFAAMGDGILARPGDHTVETRRLLDRLDLTSQPPVAAARFDDTTPVADEVFRHDSGLAEAEDAYHRFIDRYGPDGTEPPTVGEAAAMEAFVLRTMVVHDLRRARLRDPDLPVALLADDWAGHRAVTLAAELYRALTGSSWEWITELTGLTVDPSSPPLSTRFTPDPTASTDPTPADQETTP